MGIQVGELLARELQDPDRRVRDLGVQGEHAVGEVAKDIELALDGRALLAGLPERHRRLLHRLAVDGAPFTDSSSPGAPRL